MAVHDSKLARPPWSSTVTMLSILLLPAHICVSPTAASGDFHPGRRLFLRDFAGPLAASYKGEYYSWFNLEVGAMIEYFAPRRPYADVESFMALFYWLDAEEFWGRRIKLSAMVVGRIINNREGASAGLFMRVDAVDGSVMAFDNMLSRRYEQPTMIRLPKQPTQVVLEVPAPPVNDGNSCTDPARIPFRIAVGFFVVGGVGDFTVDDVVVKGVPVSPEFPVTGGPPEFWQNPCLNNLGEGYPKPPRIHLS